MAGSFNTISKHTRTW